jgi:HD-GYP domain-containing protein (c-di-GMP phosphodiesterase class II)/GAF domain-containing protein
VVGENKSGDDGKGAMTTALVQKLTGVRDLKRILEATVKEIGDSLQADCCQIMLSNPLDPNVTSLSEYRGNVEEEAGALLTFTLPLVISGNSFGSLSLLKKVPLSENETNALRILLGELSSIVRGAQINDIVQRETFRETFLFEINNVMAYSLGIGDALFMVVNILGKVLQASRCLFICTDEAQAGWKCYEFWQQDKVQSCNEFRWPTTDSPLVARTLLSRVPLEFFEGQGNSYVSPVQDEMQFIGARSALGIALRSSSGVHGCIILQQCDYRRAWTRGEIDMAQNVADKVAEALVKLPAEKRAREPIMQLHQRIVHQTAPADGDVPSSIQAVRAALKGALGQQSIPSAVPSAPPTNKRSAAKPPPVIPPQPITQLAAGATATGKTAVKGQSGVQSKGKPGAPEDPKERIAKETISPDLAKEYNRRVTIARGGTSTPASSSDIPLETGSEPMSKVAEEETASREQISSKDNAPVIQPVKAAPFQKPDAAKRASTPEEKSWGDLDAIPTPKGAPSTPGLTKTIGQKNKITQTGMQSPLLASLHKDKAAFAARSLSEKTVEMEPPAPIDEEEAQEKINRILSSANPTADYIFETRGLDTRMLGRIDGWVSEIEHKDKYVNGHARQIAEYSCAIASEMDMSDSDLLTLRQAALVHDVGKLGIPDSILQKPDDDLSDPELITVMNHTVDGANLLESFPDLAHLAPIVVAHHEEFDGNGYPKGLKGEEIAIAARIIFVANAYHSLTAEMRYGTGMSPESAQEELKQGKGKQYDPQVVDALIKCIEDSKVPAVC